MELAVGIVAAVIVVLAVLVVYYDRSASCPQARARNIERLGRYRKTLEPGMNFIIPFVDRVKPLIDLREQVVSFKGQPVITEDNLVVLIDTVLFFQVTDPRAADYEIVNYIQAIEQITATMLRSVIGTMDLEQTLTSRDKINTMLRGVLDDASGKWGIRVTRVEIKAIDPPKSVMDAMEKQMRAEREKRAAILNAEGLRQSKILTAEGEKQSNDPAGRGREAERDPAGRGPGPGDRHGVPGRSTTTTRTPRCSPTSTCRPCRSSPRAEGNTFWVIPSEVTTALKMLSSAFEGSGAAPENGHSPSVQLPMVRRAEVAQSSAPAQVEALTNGTGPAATGPEANVNAADPGPATAGATTTSAQTAVVNDEVAAAIDEGAAANDKANPPSAGTARAVAAADAELAVRGGLSRVRRCASRRSR